MLTKVFKAIKRFKRLITILKLLYESQTTFRRFIIKSGLFVTLAIIALKLIKKLRCFLKPNSQKKSIKTKTPNLDAQFFKEFTYLLKIFNNKKNSNQQTN